MYASMADLRRLILGRRRLATARAACFARKDRISNLPDDILQRILSLLPTKYAIRTTALSKQWHGLWERLCLQEQAFQNPTTKTFHEYAGPIVYPQESSLFLSNICLDLFNKHVETKERFKNVLLVDVVVANDKSLERTISSFALIEHLDLAFRDGLKLGGCHWRQGWPTMAFSRTLKKLTLQIPNMSSNWFQTEILQNFPSLQDLTVSRCYSLVSINLSSTTIKTLRLDQCHSLHDITIDAPALEDFRIASRNVVSFNATKIINANWEFLRSTVHLYVRDHRQALRLLQLTADVVNLNSELFDVRIDYGSIKLISEDEYCSSLSITMTNQLNSRGVTIPERFKGNFLPPLVRAKRLTVDVTVKKSTLVEFLTPKFHCFPWRSSSSHDQFFIKKLQTKRRLRETYACREVARYFDDITGQSLWRRNTYDDY